MSHLPPQGMCMTARHTGSPAITYISSIYIHRLHCLSIGLNGVVVHVASPPLRYSIPTCISLVDLFGYMYRYTHPASHSTTLHTTPGGMRQALQSAAIRGRLLPDMRSLLRYGPINACRLHAFHTPASYITPFDIFLAVLSAPCSYKLSIPLDIALISDG